ncbi:protein involved in gliding motility GldE [Lutibacter agarilyticus]|uniref:Protein involved in gliding motility GldE n=1 Tax=Lutibacter agarilyticus TaxID=1109740 RepID=A0A238VT27_9FLAO|nr:gliding motility-associated protein GldE [Lutibacter agarilyticus]SNR37396.1 protein involved in gliding motility GldE [Lutibacter agarilyticus]
MDPEPTFLFIFLVQSINYWLFLSIAVLFLLLLLSALISGAEVAFFSLSQLDLGEAAESKSSKQKTVFTLLEKPQKLLATILISNNFINILIVLIFAYIGENIFNQIESMLLRFLIEVVLVTFLILLFGEVLPKVYASRNALKFASFMALPLNILSALLSVISTPLMTLTNIIEKKFDKKQSSLSVEKLSQALELTSDEATTKEEQKILEGIVSFGNTETGQIMTPRIDIFALSDVELYEDVISKIVDKGYSRNPVYHENVDEIVGVLYAKDLLPHLNKKSFVWQNLIREPYFVPENKKLDDLLKEFQEKKNHLAVVVDEYGGTSGIVTLEDVIEEIVGDINDEFDDEDLFYTKIDAHNYLFEGKTNLKDFYKILDLENTELFDDNKGESETVAGFVLEVYGKFPKKNEVIHFKNYLFKIEAMEKKRIKKIKVTIPN